jgi:hypothetical protein
VNGSDADGGPERHAFAMSADEHDLLVRRVLELGGPVHLLLRVGPMGDGLVLRLTLDELLDVAQCAADAVAAGGDPVEQLVLESLCDRLEAFLLSCAPKAPTASEGPAVVSTSDGSAVGVGLTLGHFYRLATDWDGEKAAVRLNAHLDLADVAEAPFFRTARSLLQALVEAGGNTKATPKGNLNRKFVTALAAQLPAGEEGYASALEYFGKRQVNEQDARGIHIARVVLTCARFIAREHTTIRITHQGRLLLPDDRAGELYERLFRAFFRTFNLAYLDGLPVGGDYQNLVGLGLFYLHTFSDQWRKVEYVGDLLAPRPLLPELADLPESTKPYLIPRSRLLRPLEWFGLVEFRVVGKKGYTDIEEVRKTPLFDRFISFDLGPTPTPPLIHPERPGLH